MPPLLSACDAQIGEKVEGKRALRGDRKIHILCTTRTDDVGFFGGR
jgi:hypothetical protein